jgi:DNA-binding CsgD family transcriptional regulator
LTAKPAEAVKWADEALAIGGPDASAELRAAVLVNKGSAMNMLIGQEDAAEELLLEGLAAATAVEDYLSALRAINNVAHNTFPIWQPERSAGLLAEMGRLIERSGRQDWTGSWYLLQSTFLAHVVGDLGAAREHGEQATVHGGKRVWSNLGRAELALEAGDEAEAEALLEGLDVPDPSTLDDVDERGRLLALRVRLAARRGSLDAVETALSSLAAEMVGLAERQRLFLCDPWHHALVAALHAGLPASAGRALVRRVSVEPAGRIADPGWPPHLAGALAEAEGRAEVAVAAYEEAIADHGWRRSPAAAADAHLGAARCLLLLDRRDEARSHAGQAAALLERWPGWRQEEARTLLRRLGAAAPAGSGTTGLTGREQEVAVLVAEGLTNGEVAARLFISTKTASVHVSNILRKLGMGSRAEVAAWVVRESLGR